MLNMSFNKQILAGFVLSLLLVFSVFYVSYTSINNLQSSEDAADHSQAVINTANEVRLLLLNSETGQRGYIATQDEKFLEPYTRSVYKVPAMLTKLKMLIGDKQVQLNNLDSLSDFSRLKINELRRIIDIAHAAGFNTARKEMRFAKGKFYMDRARSYVVLIIKEETGALNIKNASADRAARSTIKAMIIGGTVVTFVVLVLFFYIQRTFLKLRASEENIRATNIELGKAVSENRNKNWLLSGAGWLNEKMQGQQSESQLAENILSEICAYTNAAYGTFYLLQDDEQVVNLSAIYGFSDLKSLKKTIKLTEGWVCRAIKDKKPAIVKGRLQDNPELTLPAIHQPLTDCFIVPLFFDKKLIGLIEIAFAGQLEDRKKDYILIVADNVGIAINTARARTTMQTLLGQLEEKASLIQDRNK